MTAVQTIAAIGHDEAMSITAEENARFLVAAAVGEGSTATLLVREYLDALADA